MEALALLRLAAFLAAVVLAQMRMERLTFLHLALAQRLARFANLLESDTRLAGSFALEGGTFHYIANDRLRLPNTAEAFAALQPDLEAAGASLYGSKPVSVMRLDNDPRERLTAVVSTAGPLSLATLAV